MLITNGVVFYRLRISVGPVEKWNDLDTHVIMWGRSDTYMLIFLGN